MRLYNVCRQTDKNLFHVIQIGNQIICLYDVRHICVASNSSSCELNHTSIQIRNFLGTNVTLVAVEMVP